MITQNRNEITAVREDKAKMVALNQRDAQTKWGRHRRATSRAASRLDHSVAAAVYLRHLDSATVAAEGGREA